MKKVILISFVTLAMSFVSCESDIPELEYAGSQNNAQTSQYSIEEAEIIALNAYDAMFSKESRSTSSSNRVMVSDAWVYAGSGMSRAVAADTVFYVVEFKNGGFALVAADKSLDDNIYAISDRNTFGKERCEYVDRYIEEMAKTIQYRSAPQTRKAGSLIGPNTIFRTINGIPCYGFPTKFNRNVDPILNTLWSQDGNGTGGSCDDGSSYKDYNSYCPNYDFFTRCPAGCVAIAMSQILACMQMPKQIGGRECSWSELTSVPHIYQLNQKQQDDLSYIIHQIGVDARTVYGIPQSVSTFERAFTAFQKYGLTVEERPHDFELIQKSI